MTNRRNSDGCEGLPGRQEWPRELRFTLEPEPLLEQFRQWVAAEVPLAGVQLDHPATTLALQSPPGWQPGRGGHLLQLPIAQGSLTFFRDTPFSASERLRLQAFAVALHQPLQNALRYHAACRENRHLNARLALSERACSSLRQIEPAAQTVPLSQLVRGRELERALRAGELVLYYQPKVDLKSGAVMGLEALLRWHHGERGVLQPDDFIPLAEQSGLIREITRWVLNAVLRQCALWHRQGLLVPIAVNLSGLDLEDTQLPDYLMQLLDAWAVPVGFIELEVTETMAIGDEQRSLEVLGRLSALGVSVAVDDFGIGYSSLQRLKLLPINTIKIDKSFVTHIACNEQDRAMVDAITRLGHRLGMKVVAEGVESLDGWLQLAAAGCDMGQGFHISRPLSGEAITGWLRESLLRAGAWRDYGVVVA